MNLMEEGKDQYHMDLPHQVLYSRYVNILSYKLLDDLESMSSLCTHLLYLDEYGKGFV